MKKKKEKRRVEYCSIHKVGKYLSTSGIYLCPICVLKKREFKRNGK